LGRKLSMPKVVLTLDEADLGKSFPISKQIKQLCDDLC